MSGYRSLHREHILPNHAIWSVATTPLLRKKKNPQDWRFWVGSSNGQVLQTYVVQEISLQDKAADLNASAVRLRCSHEFVGVGRDHENDEMEAITEAPNVSLGCSSVSIVRNYTGEDNDAGDFVVMTMEVAGRVRIWNLSEDWDASFETDPPDRTAAPSRVKALYEFEIENATGTAASLCPPRVSGQAGEVMAAIPCLDGTVAMVATGLATPNYTKNPSSAGTMLDTWGSRGSSIPLSLCWHPTQAHVLAVGRKDGTIDILTQTRKNQHRMTGHTAPVRAVAFTDDGHLLVSGSDAGTILIWDYTRHVPALVHHVMEAHKSWILNIVTLPDSRRFVTCGADRKVHVWNVGQIHQAVHSFQTDVEVWGMALGPSGMPNPRLVTGSEDGLVQLYSLEK